MTEELNDVTDQDIRQPIRSVLRTESRSDLPTLEQEDTETHEVVLQLMRAEIPVNLEPLEYKIFTRNHLSICQKLKYGALLNRACLLNDRELL